MNDLFANLNLNCYYFETLSGDVNSPRRLPDVNKRRQTVWRRAKPNFVIILELCYCHVM